MGLGAPKQRRSIYYHSYQVCDLVAVSCFGRVVGPYRQVVLSHRIRSRCRPLLGIVAAAASDTPSYDLDLVLKLHLGNRAAMRR